MKNLKLFILLFAFAIIGASCEKEYTFSSLMGGDWQYLCYDGQKDQVSFQFREGGQLCEKAPGLDPMCMGAWSYANPGDPLNYYVQRDITQRASLWQVEVLSPDIIQVTALTDDPDAQKTNVEVFTLIRNNLRY